MVDYERRLNIAPNHTMTHVLNFALRKVLCGELGSATGGMCDQKGSYVDDEKLRFDFSWSGSLTPEQVEEVERIVNETIEKELSVHAYVAPLEQAGRIQSLRMVFGERYPDPVRVLSVGQEVPPMLQDPENPAWSSLSVEFCGGTHLSNTKEAKSFRLLEEVGVAKGIRRIVGVTKEMADKAQQTADAFEAQLKAAGAIEDITLDTEAKRLGGELDILTMSLSAKNRFRKRQMALFQKSKVIKKKVMEQRVNDALERGTREAGKAKASGLDKAIFRSDFGCDAKTASKVLEKVAKACPEVESFMLFTGDEESNRWLCLALIPGVTKGKKGKDANKWVQGVLNAVGGTGKGGGKGNKAQGMDRDLGKLDEAMKAATEVEF
ncbi:unnamed protein product [Discosporangium mesarthrocarpum]